MVHCSAMIRYALQDAIRQALLSAQKAGDLPDFELGEIQIETPRDPSHGDYATNAAMTHAKPAKTAPRLIADKLVQHVRSELVGEVSVAGPGFINFRLSDRWLRQLPATILLNPRFGEGRQGQGHGILLEYVSANPTGPLHIGHGRWAALGSALANVLKAAGYDVLQEFYVNDAGSQIKNLGMSVWARIQQEFGLECPLPEDGYHGAYVGDLARQAIAQFGWETPPSLDDELLGQVTVFAKQAMEEHQRQTLKRMRVVFDRWYHEKQLLHDSGAIDRAIASLQKRGEMYEKDGAWWLRTSAYGDDKDRVVIRSNGEKTYFAADIAYHWDKLQRQPHLIDLLGADHHGYVGRLKAIVQALGYPADALEVIIGQNVTLWRGEEQVRMSKRTGDMIALHEVIQEVGPDATRFFLLMRSADTPIDFDLELAKKEASDNPVYYVQYAHARIASILRTAEAAGLSAEGGDLNQLTTPSERQLLLRLGSYPDEVLDAAEHREPYRLCRFSQNLAQDFHRFYTECRVVDAGFERLSRARLMLALSTKNVLRHLLEELLGVSAPERM